MFKTLRRVSIQALVCIAVALLVNACAGEKVAKHTALIKRPCSGPIDPAVVPCAASQATCTPGPNARIAAPNAQFFRHQSETAWCWAAAGEMVMDALSVNADQCRQASLRFGTDCCPDPRHPMPDCCNDGGFPNFAQFGLAYCSTESAALSWEEIRFQIACKDRPIAFSWHYQPKGGHMMVIVGYVEAGGIRQVIVLNPDDKTPFEYTYTYDDYVAMQGVYDHWNDYYDVRR